MLGVMIGFEGLVDDIQFQKYENLASEDSSPFHVVEVRCDQCVKYLYSKSRLSDPCYVLM
jgi:hypothetical protein